MFNSGKELGIGLRPLGNIPLRGGEMLKIQWKLEWKCIEKIHFAHFFLKKEKVIYFPKNEKSPLLIVVSVLEGG